MLLLSLLSESCVSDCWTEVSTIFAVSTGSDDAFSTLFSVLPPHPAITSKKQAKIKNVLIFLKFCSHTVSCYKF